MKLHLPIFLRKSLLSCLGVVVGLTLASGTLLADTADGDTPALVAAEPVTISSSNDAALTSTPAGEQIIMNLTDGYLQARDTDKNFDVAADVRIDALSVTNGNSDSTYNFLGTITGSGVFERTASAKSVRQTYVFTGDMSEYSGEMKLSKTNDGSIFKFIGNQSGTGSINIASGNTLIVDGASMNNGSIVSSGTLEVSGAATFAGDVSVNGSLTFGMDSSPVNNGSFTFADSSVINLQNVTCTADSAGNRTYQLFSTSGSGSSNLSSLTAANLSGIITAGWEWSFHDDGFITATDVARSLTYVGGSMTWNTSAENPAFTSGGEAVAFSAGDRVNFTGDSTVSLGEHIITRELSVASDATVALTTTGYSLTAESVVVDGTLQLKNGGQNGTLTGDITVRGRLEFAAGDVTGWSSSMGIKSIALLEGGNLHISVGGNDNQTGAGLALSMQGSTITGVTDANLDLAYGGALYGYSSISVLAADDATAEQPTVSSVSGTSLRLRQNATTISVAEHARLDISSVIKESTNLLNGEGAVAAGVNAGLTKLGVGELRLTGANTYTQATTVAAGTLTLADGGSLASASVTVNEGAVFRLSAGEGLSVSAAGSVDGCGLVEKIGLGSATIGGLADSFAGRIDLQQGTLSVASPLVLSAGRELSLGGGTVLDADLSLGGGLLSLADSGVDSLASLNGHALTFLGNTKLSLSGFAPDRVTDILTGVSSLRDSSGNALQLNNTNNKASLYFDFSQPGMGYWSNTYLQLTDDGILQLVRNSAIIPEGYTEVTVDEAADMTQYSGTSGKYAFLHICPKVYPNCRINCL